MSKAWMSRRQREADARRLARVTADGTARLVFADDVREADARAFAALPWRLTYRHPERFDEQGPVPIFELKTNPSVQFRRGDVIPADLVRRALQKTE